MRVLLDSQVHPLILDLGCCGVSALRIGAPGYDLPGFDGRSYDLRPEQANTLIVAGRVTRNLAPVLKELYARLAAPRWVIAYGTCSISGAVFDTIPVGQLVPVDVWVPGCPPHTDALCTALAQLPSRRPM